MHCTLLTPASRSLVYVCSSKPSAAPAPASAGTTTAAGSWVEEEQRPRGKLMAAREAVVEELEPDTAEAEAEEDRKRRTLLEREEAKMAFWTVRSKTKQELGPQEAEAPKPKKPANRWEAMAAASGPRFGRPGFQRAPDTSNTKLFPSLGDGPAPTPTSAVGGAWGTMAEDANIEIRIETAPAEPELGVGVDVVLGEHTEMTEDEAAEEAGELAKELQSGGSVDEAVERCCTMCCTPEMRSIVIEKLLNMGLDAEDADMRPLVGKTIIALLEAAALDREAVRTGVAAITEFLDDLLIDIPKVVEYLGVMLRPSAERGVIDLPGLPEKMQKEFADLMGDGGDAAAGGAGKDDKHAAFAAATEAPGAAALATSKALRKGSGPALSDEELGEASAKIIAGLVSGETEPKRAAQEAANLAVDPAKRSVIVRDALLAAADSAAAAKAVKSFLPKLLEERALDRAGMRPGFNAVVEKVDEVVAKGTDAVNNLGRAVMVLVMRSVIDDDDVPDSLAEAAGVRRSGVRAPSGDVRDFRSSGPPRRADDAGAGAAAAEAPAAPRAPGGVSAAELGLLTEPVRGEGDELDEASLAAKAEEIVKSLAAADADAKKAAATAARLPCEPDRRSIIIVGAVKAAVAGDATLQKTTKKFLSKCLEEFAVDRPTMKAAVISALAEVDTDSSANQAALKSLISPLLMRQVVTDADLPESMRTAASGGSGDAHGSARDSGRRAESGGGGWRRESAPRRQEESSAGGWRRGGGGGDDGPSGGASSSWRSRAAPSSSAQSRPAPRAPRAEPAAETAGPKLSDEELATESAALVSELPPGAKSAECRAFAKRAAALNVADASKRGILVEGALRRGLASDDAMLHKTVMQFLPLMLEEGALTRADMGAAVRRVFGELDTLEAEHADVRARVGTMIGRLVMRGIVDGVPAAGGAAAAAPEGGDEAPALKKKSKKKKKVISME